MTAARRLSAPWTLCPATTEPEQVAQELSWTAVGLEGIVFRRLDSPYQASARGWLKYKVRHIEERSWARSPAPRPHPHPAPRSARPGRAPAVVQHVSGVE
ncbi:hypothetical protein [Streptomyces sp. ALI-76-A]|uniref:hypothetical protein n=1 Tax=Streptomyces sp. ALI-76-A TaxID=3025736 RepID=UPI00256F3391|nr:hypothetical protein [Streptomyces sp. ALI-76-A]MDL5206182.1 hypothetical protein [Streptomyces sp. ALI-76-A]